MYLVNSEETLKRVGNASAREALEKRALLHEMIEFIATEVDELGNHAELAHIEKIMREGTGADRQLAVWERTQDLSAVVDHIVDETYEGLTLPRARVAWLPERYFRASPDIRFLCQTALISIPSTRS